MPISTSQIGLTVTQQPDSATAGESGHWRVQVVNAASQIPTDQTENLCTNFNQETGIDVTLAATRNETDEGGSVEMFSTEYCLLPGDTVNQDMNLEFPTEPGTYSYSFTLSSDSPPEVWDNELWTAQIGGNGNGVGNGNGDGSNIIGGSGATVFLLGVGALLWRERKRG